MILSLSFRLQHIKRINNLFTDCTKNQIQQLCIHKMDKLELEKCHDQRGSELLC